MEQIVKPHKLRPRDTVGIFSPSDTIGHRADLFKQAAQNFADQLGLKTVFAEHTFGRHYYSSGTTQERLDDFHALMADSDIKAILFSIGGKTAIDMIHGLDYGLLKNHPKIITGISDATTLLNTISKGSGLITFNGIELQYYADQDMSYQNQSIKQMFFDGGAHSITPNPNWKDVKNTPTTYAGWQTIKEGAAQGKLVGGNFASYQSLWHTKYQMPHEGSIMFFETYERSKCQIHQGLMQMRLAGIFDQIGGLVIGHCTGSDDPNVLGNEQPMKELVLEATDGYSFPIMQIGEFGHRVENFIQPIGGQVKMDATNLTFEIVEPVLS